MIKFPHWQNDMKLAITFITGIIVLAAGDAALAADWVKLGKPGAVDQYFYDRSKLTIKDEEVTFWKKVVFAAPQTINGKEIASGLLRERIHCGEHTAKLISYLYYATSGETVEYIAKDESDPAPIIPDTVGDAFEQKLCPMVWRKQEEVRIKSEQRAAEAELSAVKRPPPQIEKPNTPGAAGTGPARNPQAPIPAPVIGNTNPGPGNVPTPGRTPADPNAAPAPAAPGGPTLPGKTPADPNAATGTANPASPNPPATPGRTPADPSAAPLRQTLPMPQIIEQLY
jgi:hypothetical protein